MREYFGERLRESEPEAWRAGHERLYEHYRQATDEFPETLEAMLPLYAAVVHGCRAGRVQEALDKVYWRRIQRGNEFFGPKKLGTLGAELTALAAFFKHPWDRPDPQLGAVWQAWILNQAGFFLRALGRLPEASQPMRAGLDRSRSEENWKQAAISAGNLSELTLTQGEVAEAVQAGEESVELADRGKDWDYRVINRTILADALHQAGLWEESAADLREAEALQAEQLAQYPRLTSLQGYRYCDLLLATAEPEDGSGLDGVGDIRSPASSRDVVGPAAPADPNGWHSRPYDRVCEEVRERATYSIEVAKTNHWLLDIALDHLCLGRAHLGLALASPPGFLKAAEHLDRAVDGLRQAGQDQELPRGLLVRAALHRLRAAHGAGEPAADLAAATADLREATEIAERGHMRLFEADAHLEWTRLHLQAGDHDVARHHLDRARELVTACGYGRREREVAWLTARLGNDATD